MHRREYVILNLPVISEEPIPHPDKVIIQFSNNKSLDLGALCYLKRERPGYPGQSMRGIKKFRARRVDVDSFSPGRTKQVEKLIRYTSDQISVSGKRPATVMSLMSRFLAFMDWADHNNYTQIFDRVEVAKASVHNYLIHLIERVRFEEITLDSAATQQETVIAVFSDHFNVDDFSYGLPLLWNHRSTTNATQPPDERRLSETLNLCNLLFEGIFSFVRDFSPFPYSIEVPTHYNFPNNKLWFFPTTRRFKHPSEQSSRMDKFYDYNEGKIYTLEEMIESSPTSLMTLKKSVRRANERVGRANVDQFNLHRLQLAQLAHHCFVIMFQAETGMNWSQIINLDWTGNYEAESSRQLFRTIKWRAENREIYFEITNSFLPKFKRFLKLRDYLLKDSAFPFLFFNQWAKRPPTILADTQNSIFVTLKRICPDLIPVRNREWRAAKGDWLIRNTDLSTTALVLQNTENTAQSHYAAGSETKQILEFSDFLNSLSQSVLKRGEAASSGVDRSIGVCSDYLSPAQTVPVKNITSNCSNLEGCLFCEKFRIHADEIDTRKLLSCRYCLEKIAANFQGEPYFEDTLLPLLKRINSLLQVISEKDPELVENISKSVEIDGELEFYWAQKFQMLLELEVIA